VFDPQELLSLHRLSDALERAGITVVSQPAGAAAAVPTSAEAAR
jgi:hypothetical protein